MKFKTILPLLIVFLLALTSAAWANDPPVANAGGNQAVYTNDVVYLNGAATDTENDPIQWWMWTVVNTPVGANYLLALEYSQNATFIAQTPGQYQVALIVDDGFATSAPDIITITVAENLPPVAIATVDKTEGPAPLTVQFDGSGSYDPEGKPLTRYAWEFGDGADGYLGPTPPPHTYTVPGTYSVVILAVTDERGAVGSKTLIITVTEPNQPPVADAGPDQAVYTGDPVYLHGTASDAENDPIQWWMWTVIDPPVGSESYLSSEILPDTTFVALTPGRYLVSLIVFDGFGTSVPDTMTITVADNLPPVAVATVDKTEGPAPLTVQFDGSQSYDPEGKPLTEYFWDFGDGTPGVYGSTPPPHTYTIPGSYNVAILGVTDERGAVGSDVIVITVTEPNLPPVVAPTVTPASGTAPFAVQFAANATDPEGAPLTYLWEFGDSDTSDLASPTHTYTGAGTYSAKVTVSDGDKSASATLTVVVDPTIDFNVTRGEIDFKGKKSAVARVELYAELYTALPAPGDLIALTLEGTQLFAAPFSAFKPAEQHGNIVPGVYMLKDKDLWVRFDFNEGRLSMQHGKAVLATYDPKNGVTVQLTIGTSVAVDTFEPKDEKGDRCYRHHRPEKGREHYDRHH